jgi:CRP-like cAMP-binding protein
LPNQIRHHKKGNTLYWKGDPVDIIYSIKSGSVKISSVSPEGKVLTMEVLDQMKASIVDSEANSWAETAVEEGVDLVVPALVLTARTL